MNFDPTLWRLINTPPANGAWNMAVDEAILSEVIAGRSQPTLRLYAWTPPCLSLGYAQSFNDVDLAALDGEKWELVRRPTGGRAILHTNELTYSVTGTTDEPRLAGTILESYRTLSQALLAALHILEIPARPNTPNIPTSGREEDPVCFDIPSSYEITVEGRKLIGSAQTRRKNGVLQHGTLPLAGDLTRITRVLRYNDEIEREAAAGKLHQKALTVEEALGKPVSWDQAAKAFEQGFRSALNLEFNLQGLSPQEKASAEGLLAEKYTSPDWNERI